MKPNLTKHEKHLLRLTNAWADLLYAKEAYQLIMSSTVEDLNYHFLLI